MEIEPQGSVANSPWNVSKAILCQATLSGNIDYGFQAYQLRLKAIRNSEALRGPFSSRYVVDDS